MRVSKSFIRDFAYVANFYRWSRNEVEEVKAHTREHPDETKWYWTVLAAAHRAGYAQTPENDFIRLQPWCRTQGLGDPFSDSFDLAALQAMAKETA
jgi:hypothetical protein